MYRSTAPGARDAFVELAPLWRPSVVLLAVLAAAMVSLGLARGLPFRMSLVIEAYPAPGLGPTSTTQIEVKHFLLGTPARPTVGRYTIEQGSPLFFRRDEDELTSFFYRARGDGCTLVLEAPRDGWGSEPIPPKWRLGTSDAPCDERLAKDTAAAAEALTRWFAGPKLEPFAARWGSPSRSLAITLGPFAIAALGLFALRRLRTRVQVDAKARTVAIRRGRGRADLVLLAEIRATTVATRALGPLGIARPVLALAGGRRVPLWPLSLPGVARALRDRDTVASLLDPILARSGVADDAR